MGTRPIRFRVENNKAKSSFWYTLVAGNGDTVMTSKAKYATPANAKRAARNQIKALSEAQLVLEYEESDGAWVTEETVEPVEKPRRPLPKATSVAGQMAPMTHKPVSFVPAAEHLNPNS